MLTPGKDKGIANPIPLGLACLAITTFLLGFCFLFQPVAAWAPYFAEALVIGGIAMFLAGMWSFSYGSTMAATAFSFIGAVYGAWGLMAWPVMNLAGMAAPVHAGQIFSAGMVFVVAGAIAACFWVASFSESAVFNGTLLFLWLSWVLLGIAVFGPFHMAGEAGGSAAILCSLIALYGCFAELFNETYHREVMPVWEIPAVRDRAEQEEYERLRRLHPEVMRAGQSSNAVHPSDLRA